MRQTETVTLHFDLSHLSHLPADQEFTLKALGKRTMLKRHDQGTLRLHAAQNCALAAISEAHGQCLTHYAEDVELPADAVGFHWVGYPSSRPNAVSDEIAVVFQHVPSAAVRRAVRAMKRDGSLPIPAALTFSGVTAVADQDNDEALHVAASNAINYKQTALTMLMQHPEFGSLVPEMHYRIGQQIVVQQPGFTPLWSYMSTHPAEGPDPWYENTYAMDPAGNPIQPTTFSISDDLESLFVAGPVPQAVSAAFWNNGVLLSGSASIAAGAAADQWKVVDPGSDTTYDVVKSAAINQGQTGYVLSVSTELTDKDGNTVTWPTTTVNGQQISVIPHFRLSDGLDTVLTPAVQQVGVVIKQQPWLKGQQWSTQHGVTQLSRTNVSPTPAPVAALRASDTAQADWAVVNQTSQYGLDLYQNSISYNQGSKTLSFQVKNWANRGLGAHVQFLDPGGNPISDPVGWEDVLAILPEDIRENMEPNDTKWFLQLIGAGNVFFGVPVWTDPTTISFTVPDAASGVNVLLGGLGNGNWDLDVDLPGLIYTCIVSYGVPSVLSILSVGVQGTKWYMEFFEDPENVKRLLLVAGSAFSLLLTAEKVGNISMTSTLASAAQFAVGILFSAALAKLALKITGFTTAMEIAEEAPYVGWALRIASQASAIADMIATSVEVGLSPATYDLQAKRSMTLNVSVSPDPTHGTATQKPIWPEVSDHYVITVQYYGGTTLTKAGPMPGQEDAPISVTYATATGDALPSAPGQQFQIIANIYSASNWLCGKWTSGWIEAVPTDGDARSEAGSIIEQLVPLTASTEYSHLAKLNYDGTSASYIWEKTVFSIDDGLEPQFVAGPVPQAVSAAFWDHGVRLSGNSSIVAAGSGGPWQVVDHDMGIAYSVVKTAIVVNGQVDGYELSVSNVTEPAPPETVASLAGQDVQQLIDVTINDLAYKLGYSYYAQNQNLPEDYGTTDQSSAMFLFESISTLADPGDGMLSPTRGFSVQPYIAYDQFGPAGILRMEPAENYMPELDQGGAVSADISTAFSDAGFPLRDGAQVTVVTASAAWQIGWPGEPPVYDLRRQVDVIVVFYSPAPAFSPNNFYLDTRTYKTDNLSHLRLVNLQDGSGTTFDYSATQSWGAFGLENLNAVAIHPNGFAIAISYQDDKMAILKLPATGVDDKDAPQALPFSGTGLREGLMQGPVGMTISADGRILVLERINARIQAFDTQANPVQCFAGSLLFTLSNSFASELNDGTASTDLLRALQINVPVMNTSPGAYDPRYLLTPAFSMDASFVAVLNAGTVTQDLATQFQNNALTLGQGATILQTAQNLWLLQDSATGVNYDIRFNGEGLSEVDVYRCFTPTIIVKAANAEWLVMDKTNTLSFDVTVPNPNQPALQFRNLTSLMPLKDGPSDTVSYLDVAIETKGFIYVLSYINDGSAPADYRLDLYNPDGTPLNPDTGSHNGQVNGARMTVDQWRTVFTLNYEQMQGAAGRPEPTVSQWIPSTPGGS